MDPLLLARGAAAAAYRRIEQEWFGTPLHLATLGGKRGHGLVAHPHDLRPASPETGRQILEGIFQFGGSPMRIGPDGDPFDRPSPSRAFATELHGFGWLRDLLVLGEQGVRPGVRLFMDWRRLFGAWNAFSWSPEVLERRVFNLACAAKTLAMEASDAEIAALEDDLARQARHLLAVSEDPGRAVERAIAAGVAGCALGGPAGERLINQALGRLRRRLPKAVLADGGHASRSPQRGLELLLDLLTLEDALSQRGREPPPEMTRAIDRLGAAVRFFTLPDGRLADLQGGEAVDGATIAAALAHEEARKAPQRLAVSGYHRLRGGQIEVLVDAGAPAKGAWSLTACAQPLGLELVFGRERLIVGSGWTPGFPAQLRLTGAGSCAVVGDLPCGEVLEGAAAEGLGPRLVDGPGKVGARREDGDGAALLMASHDGWLRRLGLMHHRTFFMNTQTGELRGEDRFEPPKPKEADGPRRYVPFSIHFQLAPEVRASLAQDGKTVILRGPTKALWLRNDAAEVTIEPSQHVSGGELKRSSQVVLRGQVRHDKGGRVRWKLSASET
ncbi:MAG: heparinase II/III family protein [Parcubacteria group bacterium]